MTAYLSFETLKISKRWMPRVITILLAGGVILYFWGTAGRSQDIVNILFPRALVATLFATAFFAAFLWPVLGGSWAGNEYGWGTIRMILTRRPYRIEHIAASLIILIAAIAVALVAALVVGSIAGVAVGVLTGHGAFSSGVLTGSFLGTVAKTFLAAWYVGVFYLIVAFASAVIFRSPAVGIGIGLGSLLAQFLLFDIFRSLGGFWQTIAQHFPVMYSNPLTQDVAAAGFQPGTSLAMRGAGDPSIQSSVLVLGAWMVGLLVVSAIAARARDIVD